jgi:ech hydrogenase subunit D
VEDKSYLIQEFIPIKPGEIFEKARDVKAEGHRLVQICASVVPEGYELLYTYDKDHVLVNHKVIMPVEEEIMSITGVYWSAFVFENELQDLFDVKFKHMELNYGGHFFTTSEPHPWKPESTQEGEE